MSIVAHASREDKDDNAGDAGPADRLEHRRDAVRPSISRENYRQFRSLIEQLLGQLDNRSFSPRIRLLTKKQVVQATGLAASTLDQLVGAGDFPRPRKLGKRTYWRESTIIAWLDATDPNRGKEWVA